jgi:hypothetical protein
LVLEPLSTLEDATPATGKTNRLLVDVCADPEDVTPDLRYVSAVVSMLARQHTSLCDDHFVAWMFSLCVRSSSTMVNSVLQGMRRPGLFSLNSFLAIRATLQPAPSKAGVAVFEAVLPNIDLRLTRIHPIAFLGTSLANQLLSGPTRTGRTGYLTLNETRKLVPILETDPMLVSIPLVGVWFSDGSVDFGEDGASNLAHPTIWAACIRYLFCTEFKDKASVDDRTFLLVVVGSAGLRYYEVQGTLRTATSALEPDHPDGSAAMIALQQPPATVSCVCLDFTVDLPVVEGMSAFCPTGIGGAPHEIRCCAHSLRSAPRLARVFDHCSVPTAGERPTDRCVPRSDGAATAQQPRGCAFVPGATHSARRGTLISPAPLAPRHVRRAEHGKATRARRTAAAATAFHG